MADPLVDVKIRGIRQLEAGARDLFADIERAETQDAVMVTADQVAATVRGRVPHRTGRLASTVQVVRVGNVGQVRMGAGLPYAKWIEFGAYRGRKPRRGRYVFPIAKRTERAFRKHAETVCAHEIKGQSWPNPR